MGLIPSRLNMYIYIWLVVWTPLKIWKSVGMMIIPNIWKVIKFMFQTINHIYISDHITSTSSLDPIFHHLRWAHPHVLTNLVPSLLSLAWRCWKWYHSWHPAKGRSAGNAARSRRPSTKKWPEIPVVSTNKTPLTECIILFITSYN